MIRCPVCRCVDDEDGYDVGGADDGCLFCNGCGTEIELDWWGWECRKH